MINAGFNFKSKGDSEIILKSYMLWGPEFVERLNGMFAIAIYDSNLKKMFIYRDRLGVKPLYYTHDKESKKFWFASEIKAFY